jgi:hypothetical protein
MSSESPSSDRTEQCRNSWRHWSSTKKGAAEIRYLENNQGSSTVQWPESSMKMETCSRRFLLFHIHRLDTRLLPTGFCQPEQMKKKKVTTSYARKNIEYQHTIFFEGAVTPQPVERAELPQPAQF